MWCVVRIETVVFNLLIKVTWFNCHCKQVVLLSSGLRMFKLPNFWDGINNLLFFEQNFCYQPQQGLDFIQQSFYGPRLEFVLQKGYQYDYILFDCV